MGRSQAEGRPPFPHRPRILEKKGRGFQAWDTLGGPNPPRHIHPLVLTPLGFPEVIGVAELVNKINGPWFSKFDEDLATAFSIYCGISIAHVSRDRAGRCRTPCSLLRLDSPYSIQTSLCFCQDSEPCCWVAVQPSVPAGHLWT